MSNNIASIRSVPEPVATQLFQEMGTAQPVQPAAETVAPTPRSQAPDLRLVIEEDEATGAFVYKTLDRRTGEVVQQLPRESVLKAMSAEDYSPGLVVDTRD